MTRDDLARYLEGFSAVGGSLAAGFMIGIVFAVWTGAIFPDRPAPAARCLYPLND